jgi:hypothetical protein
MAGGNKGWFRPGRSVPEPDEEAVKENEATVKSVRLLSVAVIGEEAVS